jgi:hypothetical protein
MRGELVDEYINLIVGSGCCQREREREREFRNLFNENWTQTFLCCFGSGVYTGLQTGVCREWNYTGGA